VGGDGRVGEVGVRSPGRRSCPSGRRVAVRTLVTVAIALVTVLALVTAADAKTVKFRSTVANLERRCAPVGGDFVDGTDVSGAVHGTCYGPGGMVDCVDGNKGQNCTGTTYSQLRRRKGTILVLDEIRALGATSVGTVSDSSTVWTQTVRLPTNVNGVGILKDVVCNGLGGQFAASQDAAVGACRTPTVDVICQNNQPGNNCAGFADTTKHAVATRKRIQALLKMNSSSGPSGTPTPGGSTTPGGASTPTTHGTTATTQPTTPTTQPAPTTTMPQIQ
jgi:putative hemolysin